MHAKAFSAFKILLALYVLFDICVSLGSAASLNPKSPRLDLTKLTKDRPHFVHHPNLREKLKVVSSYLLAQDPSKHPLEVKHVLYEEASHGKYSLSHGELKDSTAILIVSASKFLKQDYDKAIGVAKAHPKLFVVVHAAASDDVESSEESEDPSNLFLFLEDPSNLKGYGTQDPEQLHKFLELQSTATQSTSSLRLSRLQHTATTKLKTHVQTKVWRREVVGFFATAPYDAYALWFDRNAFGGSIHFTCVYDPNSGAPLEHKWHTTFRGRIQGVLYEAHYRGNRHYVHWFGGRRPARRDRIGIEAMLVAAYEDF